MIDLDIPYKGGEGGMTDFYVEVGGGDFTVITSNYCIHVVQITQSMPHPTHYNTILHSYTVEPLYKDTSF